MFGAGVRLLFTFVMLCAALQGVRAEERLALLIGNQNYAKAIGPLNNPLKDVALIEASLKTLGFKVTVLTDADYRTMDIALKRHAAALPFTPISVGAGRTVRSSMLAGTMQSPIWHGCPRKRGGIIGCFRRRNASM